MSKTSMKNRLLYAISGLALSFLIPNIALAQNNDDKSQIEKGETIVVRGQISYRDRTKSVVPTLEYGQEYFQNFEPLTVGDALKRVPSITFLSDVIEADGVRMRGLDPGYTQILINGEKVPGSENDRSFFVDRIPAELIKSVEIVRSSSARRSGDAMAGTINIKLRDAYALDGGFIRTGIGYFNDNHMLGNMGLVWGGEIGEGRLLLGLSAQGRRNPKEKYSYRYSQPPAGASTFVNREDQTDLRNGTDYSFNANYNLPLFGGEFDFGLFYVKTDREQNERSLEMNVAEGGVFKSVRQTGIVGNLLTDNIQLVDILQDNYSLNTKFKKEIFGGKIKVSLGYSSFDENIKDSESEVDFDRSTPRFTGDLQLTDKLDTEFTGKIGFEKKLSENLKLEFGFDYQDKNRDTLIKYQRNRFNLTSAARSHVPETQNPLIFSTVAFNNLLPILGGNSEIDETRKDIFAVIDGKQGAFEFEAGLRYEQTNVAILDKTASASLRNTENSFDDLLPSFSLRYNLTPNDRIILSAAKTVKRASFSMLSPALFLAEYGDNDFIGNPNLESESAIGADIGFEHKIGKRGIVGFNFFYRDVTDLIEIYNTGAEGDEGPGTYVLSARNLGDGKVQGFEIDFSSPLDFIGMPNTGLFANYSWLDSEVEDEFGTRLFNDQSDYVLNIGFIHDLPKINTAFGATYRKQGDAFGRIIGEEVETSYSAELEAFIEKRFNNNLTLRFVGSNLLNSEKAETFHKFVTIDDQNSRSYDEFELEKETAGAVYQLVLRYAF